MAERGEAIVLVGFMGTGKSSVGRALQQLTGLRRYDTDQMIARRFDMPIAQIFAQHGERAFRDAEAEALAELPTSAAVIVTGGGAVVAAGHVEKIRRLGVVAQLTADLDTLMERLSRRATRPLLQTADPRKTVEELLAAREPFYRAAADFTIETSGLRHDEVAARVLAGTEEVRQHVG
ncbi:MAG: shikimate kinase [Chthoniobacterales bacterium]